MAADEASTLPHLSTMSLMRPVSLRTLAWPLRTVMVAPSFTTSSCSFCARQSMIPCSSPTTHSACLFQDPSYLLISFVTFTERTQNQRVSGLLIRMLAGA
ncbi:hypothetical protein FGO68_gene14509 [Halteria grandinella]|uniref:Uncharacterized protein n=1 Tax=Halteria grandinella TaxID=5974 RepID=A0A8J8NNJ6_HALGN|nr:hypothetical protein FGO68_gene14509 [Halteria grandinella]